MDEWAYYVHEQAAQAPEPEENILKAAAVVLEVPEPDLGRPRAKSTGCFTLPRRPLEYPFSKRERQRAYDPAKWALQEYSAPKVSGHLELELGISFLDDVAASAALLVRDLASTQESLTKTFDKLDVLAIKSSSHSEKEAQLTATTTSLKEALAVYDNLEEATRALNKPGLRLVTSRKFPEMLQNLEAGLEFCRAHSDFKDIDLYELRFSQCLARAYGMLLEYCTGVWRSAETEVLKAMPTASAVTKDALLWPKFAAECQRAKDLLLAVDSSSQVHAEVRQSYATVRTQLLGTYVKALHSQQFNSTIARLKDLLHKELDLWTQIFDTDHGFSDFELQLSEPLYIEIRGTIVRQDSLEVLGEIITLLQDEESPLFSQISKDAQNRLLFCADQQVEKLLATKVTGREVRDPSFVFSVKILDVLNAVQTVMTPAIFANFAHQTVRSALDAMTKCTYPSLAPIESLVFQIKQLVALQNGLQGFELDQASTPSIDFSGLKQLLKGWNLSESLPRVTQERYDSLQDVYAELQRVVKLYTNQSSSKLLAPLEARSAKAAETETRNLRSKLPTLLSQIKVTTERHIKDPKVVQALLDAIVETLRADYADYYSQIHTIGTPDELQGVPDPDAFGVYLSELSA